MIMANRDVDITDLEEFDDVSEFYFDDQDVHDQVQWDDDDIEAEDDSFTFRPISEL